MSMRSTCRYLLPLFLTPALIACNDMTAEAQGSTAVTAATAAVAAAAPAATGPTPSGTFVMCDLMPGAEVASHSPFTIPLKETTPHTVAEGCSYWFDDDDGDMAGIAIVVTNMLDHAAALQLLTSKNQHAIESLGLQPQRIDGLGDSASALDAYGEVGLQVVTGNRVIDVNLEGQDPPVTPAQKLAAARTLAELVLTRLP
jgi:hypothetical protein